MDALFAVIGYIAGLIIFMLFLRKALGLDKILEEQNKTRLLIQKMAEKAGVSKEDIDFVVGNK